MALYRPEFFGRCSRSAAKCCAGRREFVAVFTSRLNECPFCVRVHTESTRVESGGRMDVGDPGSVRPEPAAVLPLLEKVTRTPELVSRADVDAARAVGVPDAAIVDALRVNLVSNVMNRLANAFDFRWDSDGHVRLAAKVIHRVDYRLPGILMR